MKNFLVNQSRTGLFLLLTAISAFGQNYVSVVGTQIGGSAPVTGTISFQAVNTSGKAISYQVGGGGQQIINPTICNVTNGTIASGCQFANVLLTSPQNFCTQIAVKNTSGQIVIGGANTGYQCAQMIPNNSWCVAATCNFNNFQPYAPTPILAVTMPLPYTLTLGGIFAGDCAAGLVASGYNSTGHPDCVPQTSGGGGVWGQITGVLSAQTDLQTALNALAPLASPALTGAPTTPEPSVGDSSNQIANTLWVRAQGYAPINSPNFTGTPTATAPPTPDSSNKIATTAWVNQQGFGVGTGNVTGPGTSVVGHIALYGSTNGQTITDATFGFPLAPANIGTLVAGSNGLAASATTDTTNAANISSGTLNAARLPLPGATTLGGIKSYTAIAHQWINSLTTSGVAVGSQPACADLSNAANSCSVDTTNATNISSGTLSPSRIGTFTAGANGFVSSAFIDTTNASNITSGTLAIARLGTLAAGSNGLAASATTDTTNASNISTGTLLGSRMSPVNLASSTNGGVTGILPVSNMASGYAFSSLAGTANVAQLTAYASLTYGSTITWAVGSAPAANAVVTLTGTTAGLNLTGLVVGGSYVLRIKQDSTGGRVLTLGMGCTWIVANGGHGAIALTTTGGATDLLSFTYDGTNCMAALLPNLN